MNDADSVVEDHSGEPEGGDVFNMDGAVETLGNDLFPNSEANDGESTEESIDESTEEPVDEINDEPSNEPAEEPDDATVETKTAPQSWKKDMHESWSSLDPAVQDYIETRENQMKEGLDTDRGDANLGRMMRDVMTPYSDMLQQQQIDEPTAVKYLMNAHYQLTNAPPEQKAELIKNLADSYGVQLAPTEGGQAPTVDPKIQSLEQKVYSMESAINARTQADLQVARDRVESEVESFASEHPYFEEVESDIARYITAGDSLEEAYEKAIWSNPITREKEMDRVNKEKEAVNLKKAEEKVKIAKKAKGPNVKNRDTHSAPTGPTGTMEDTIAETLREIRSR